ncbi:MAG: hypothetical protein IJI22_04780 [Bacilli bacterium]|nr:hypothetical protein [Bacilli bacterium]
MQDNINQIISNALYVEKDNLAKNVKDIVKQIYKVLVDNKDVIEDTNKIDKKNDNGFIIDFNIIENIISNIEKEKVFYGDVTLSEKDDIKKIIYGKQIMDYGNVVVISDGNPYITIEMIIRNIMAGNTTILSNSGYMYGTNQLLVQLIQSVLEQFNISKYLVQIYLSEEFDDILANFANIDLVVCVGDHDLQRLVLNKSKNETIVSGYENFDLYIEDLKYIDFLNKILDLGVNIQLYLNSNLGVDVDEAIIVDSIDEAVAQINYNGNRYSSAIFTNSSENASKFIREVKSKQVTVNTSPTIERIFDIKQSYLVVEKTIIYPLELKFDGEGTKIDLN